MSLDILGRRLRQGAPQPRTRHFGITEADLFALSALDRHGPLPTHYLYEFQKHLRTNYGDFQKRLTEFFNGDQSGPLLERPRQQFAGVCGHYQHVVYDLTLRARRLLAADGTLSHFSGRRPDPFLHQLMNGCVGASIALGARAHGLRYISREEILASPKCPEATRRDPNPLLIPLPASEKGKALIPDDLFGFEYPGVGYRFFAMEVDRGTEPLRVRKERQSSFGRKIDGYSATLRSRAYYARWGVPNLTVLMVTTTPNRAAAMLDQVGTQAPQELRDRFLVTFEAAFGVMWRVPQTLLLHLVDQPWRTTYGSKDITRP